MNIPQLALLSLRQGGRICNSPPDPAARQLPAGKMNQNRQESAPVIPWGLTGSAGNHPCWAGPDSDMTPGLNIHNMLTASANCRAYSAVAIGRGYPDRRPQGPPDYQAQGMFEPPADRHDQCHEGVKWQTRCRDIGRNVDQFNEWAVRGSSGRGLVSLHLVFSDL